MQLKRVLASKISSNADVQPKFSGLPFIANAISEAGIYFKFSRSLQ
jgi:hypothetical protein